MSANSTNYIQHLNAFLSKIQHDDRLTACHVSLYIALFSFWNQQFFKNPFYIIREKVLRICHIGSFNTYSKCLNDLHTFGYIQYAKAQYRGQKSAVSLLPIATSQNDTRLSVEIDATDRKYAPSLVADLRPIIKQVNILNNERGDPLPPMESHKPEDLDEVKDLFRQLGESDKEAAKFFHHYEMNGWKQAGKIPITNWKAAAHKWLLNIHLPKQINNDKHKHRGTSDTNEGKDYSTPL